MRNHSHTRQWQHHRINKHRHPTRCRAWARRHMTASNHFITTIAQHHLWQIKEKYRKHQNKHNECIGNWIFINIFNRIKNLDRHHLPVIKNQRRTQIGKRPNKNNNSSGKISWQHQRKRHGTKQSEPTAAHIASSFFQTRIHIGQCSSHIEIHNRIQMKHF